MMRTVPELQVLACNTGVSDHLKSHAAYSLCSITQTQNGILIAFDQELSQYLLFTKNATAFSEVNALAFWKQHNLPFLLLKKIARVYLAVSVIYVCDITIYN